MSKSKSRSFLICSLAGCCTFWGLCWFIDLSPRSTKPSSAKTVKSQISDHADISLGEELLIKTENGQKKQAAIQAFSEQNYLKSIQYLQTTLLEQPNDPEAHIYLNNSRLRLSQQPTLQIAVSIPAGKNPAIAQEMLRGIAQAQTEINELGIHGAGLAITIVNDNNDETDAKLMAEKVIADPNILAVIGSNASGPSLAAAKVYRSQERESQPGPEPLVMISPTSFTGELSGFGSHVFRTIPSMKSLAEELAKHAVQVKKKMKMGICYDSEAIDNVSFKDDFVQAYTALEGELINVPCDLSKLNRSDMELALSQIQAKTDALMIAPHIDRQGEAIALIEATQGKMQLFSTPTLYTSTILSQTKSGLSNMVLAAPWYAENYSATSFLAHAEQRWGEEAITWRTATSFDAVQAIATAIRTIPPDLPITRSSLKKQLRSQEFLALGAGESIKFLDSGDRAGQAILVKVEGKVGQYQFVAVAK